MRIRHDIRNIPPGDIQRNTDHDDQTSPCCPAGFYDDDPYDRAIICLCTRRSCAN
ncbi:hypothetical protein AFE_2427 [Acidithiobacillus ferrooxidans ATCC 23270]|uniref:Uncharacterized protein n=1 Tax=Acidithiobacillus ferrooxidans (strain ATCC 23270 / DSM 14882 / CIP 104768 / NCIMB 8455) TaxID=243159 RepID=B7J6W7_ACIF2|nr:hypothetical protein AFE_2427 [Acidithiobacillus ferrooxidans ATCC 23270]